LLSITSIPATYKRIIGPATNHIVTPLPSGVINAPNIVHKVMAYLNLDLQKVYSTIPDTVRAHIIIGS
jgi:hypothetical protein